MLLAQTANMYAQKLYFFKFIQICVEMAIKFFIAQKGAFDRNLGLFLKKKSDIFFSIRQHNNFVPELI